MDETIASGDSNAVPDVPLEADTVYRLTIDTFVVLPDWAASVLVAGLGELGLQATVEGSQLVIVFAT